MDCQQVLGALYSYLDQDADTSVSAEIQKHIELCRACFNCCEFERLLREHMRKKTDHECPEKLKIRIRAMVEKFEGS